MNSNLVKLFKGVGGIAIVVLAGIGVLAILLFLLTGRFARPDQGIQVQETHNPSDRKPVSLRFSLPQYVYGAQYSITKVLLVDPEARSGFSKIGSYSSSSSDDYGTPINVIFLNAQKEDFRLLFAKPCLIQNIYFPTSRSDSLQKSIVFEVYAGDSDKDGVIGPPDNLVLFSSTLDGHGLTQLTPDSLSVIDWKYTNNSEQLIIVAKVRPPDRSVKEEFWERTMLWYDLSTKALISYAELDSLLDKARDVLQK
jgi:hypothetical protein